MVSLGQVIALIKAMGGSGGGSSLPSVSSTDNGDVLTVVNGAWDKAAPSGLPAVTSADNGKGLSVQNGAWAKDFFAGYDVVVKIDKKRAGAFHVLTDEDLHLLKGSWDECVRLMDAALPIRACVFYHKFGDNNYAESEIYTVSTDGWHDYGDVVNLYVTGGSHGYEDRTTIYLTESGLSLTEPE